MSAAEAGDRGRVRIGRAPDSPPDAIRSPSCVAGMERSCRLLEPWWAGQGVGPARGDSATGRPAQTRRLIPRNPRVPGARPIRGSPAAIAADADRGDTVPVLVSSRWWARRPASNPGDPMAALRVRRHDEVRLGPDPSRVITAPFIPRDDVYPDGSSRLTVVIDRIMALSEREVSDTLHTALGRFEDRHRDLDGVLDRNFEHVRALVDSGETDLGLDRVSSDRRHLIAAYFTHEYSIEAAALGNPSMVAAPDQSGIDPGEQRFVMSLRAIGEGHRSSVEFRTGVIAADATVRLDETAPYATTATRIPHEYDTSFFRTKLGDLSMWNDVEARVFARLDDRFTMADLETAIAALDVDGIERSISGRPRGCCTGWPRRTTAPRSPRRSTSPNVCCSRAGRPRATGWRTPGSSGSSTTTARHLLRDLHRLRRSPDPAAAARDDGLRRVPDRDAVRSIRAQQGPGHLPAPHRRQLRGVRAVTTT
jgi:hypothetical protein